MEIPILIFDIEGEYGHFRKYNTTTSPLTYSIPPRTAIVGVLGAILGIKRELTPNDFPNTPVQELFNKKEAFISVQIINPVKKVNIGFNLINTKKSFFNINKDDGHSQINFELLKDPKFRIFVYLKNKKLFVELENRLKERKFIYTPYLGLTQFIANINFIDKRIAIYKQRPDEYINIISALNLNNLSSEKNSIKFDYNLYYVVNTMYIEMNRNREVLEYADVLIERNGKPIRAKVNHYYEVDKFGKIVFL